MRIYDCNIDYMQLDSQFNVQFAQHLQLHSRSPTPPEQNQPRTLHRQYLQLYEEQQMHSQNFEDQAYSQTYRSGLEQAESDVPLYFQYSQKAMGYKIFVENSVLRKDLQQAYRTISILREQLSVCKCQVTQMRKLADQRVSNLSSKQGFILEELQAVLQSKNLLDQEVQHLKAELKDSYSYHPLHPLHTEYPKQSNRRSLQLRKAMKQGQPGHSGLEGQQEQLQSNTKIQRSFIRSIEDMYQKTVGVRQRNLRTIWRWLKQLAFAYSVSVRQKMKNHQGLGAFKYSSCKPRTITR